MDTAILKSIINNEESKPLYESYGPNTDLWIPELVIAKGSRLLA